MATKKTRREFTDEFKREAVILLRDSGLAFAHCDGAGPGAIGAAALAQPGKRGWTGSICFPAWGRCGRNVG